MSSFNLVRSNPNATSPSISTTNCSRPYTGTARFRCSQTTGRKQTPHLRGEGVWNKAALAMTYFPRGLPPKYRRRWHVSRPCSGWERVGPCHFTIGRQGYLALEGGPPSFPLDSSCPVVLAHAPPADRNLPLRGSHPSGRPFQGRSGRLRFSPTAAAEGHLAAGAAVNPAHPTRGRYHGCVGLGSLPVRSPLLGESRLMSLPPGTEMFQFPDWPLPLFTRGVARHDPGGVAPFGHRRLNAC